MQTANPTFSVPQSSLLSPSRAARATFRANPLLARLALLHLALIPIELLLFAVDPRIVNSESVWLKPLRFDLSIAVYAVSMAWVLSPLSQERRDWFSRRIAIAMLIETPLITLQAARGVASHFNLHTLIDNAVFTAMGIGIAYNTWLLVRILIVFLRAKDLPIDGVLQRAIVLGLGAILLGSIIGGVMAGRLTHAGLHGGDMRIAHFVGLHGLQLLLVAGLLVRRFTISEAAQKTLLGALFVAHLSLTCILFAGA